MSKWHQLLSQLQSSRTDSVPKGYLTANQLAQSWHVQPARARQRLKELHSAGLVDRKTFKILTGSLSYPVPVPHYKPL